MNRIVAAGVSVLVACANWAAAQEDKEHARARLICETKTVGPGTTAWLGLDFEIDDHWHLYWNGVNDSGFAPQMKPQFPAGFKAGAILWPAPKRLVLPGDILDHIYEKHVTLLIPVEIPASAEPGSTVELKASVEWLVCHEVCLPGDAELSTRVVIAKAGEKPEPGPEAALFTKARERIPKALPKEHPPVKVVASGEKVRIEAPEALEVAFYPGLEGVTLTNLIKEGVAKGDTMVLGIRRDPAKGPILKGVLEVKPRGGGLPKLWYLEADLETNKAVPGSSNPDTRPRGD